MMAWGKGGGGISIAEKPFVGLGIAHAIVGEIVVVGGGVGGLNGTSCGWWGDKDGVPIRIFVITSKCTSGSVEIY